MNGFLLDTNTVSELVSLKPSQQVLDWMDAADGNRLYLNAMTLGEICRGVASLPQSQKRTRLESWLEVDLRSRFAGRKGMTLPVVDGLIAATALHHNLTAVTRNISDFAVAGLSVINLWQS